MCESIGNISLFGRAPRICGFNSHVARPQCRTAAVNSGTPQTCAWSSRSSIHPYKTPRNTLSSRFGCQASDNSEIEPESDRDRKSVGPPDDDFDFPDWLGIGGGLAVYLGLIGYVAYFSPNLTPYNDQYFVQKALNLVGDDGYVLNDVFYCLFNIMGIYPLIYAALLIPSARSKNKVPAWPFVLVSVFTGAFALLPYFAIWQPDENVQSPPKKSEMEGWSKFMLRLSESALYPVTLALGGAYLIGRAALATPEDWTVYGQLFSSSRLVHVTSLDFLILTISVPFWMSNDAEKRNWDQRDKFIPALSCLPVIGPAIYLVLRPKAKV